MRTQGGKNAESSKTTRLVSTNRGMPISVASFCNIIYLSVFATRQEKTPACRRESTLKELKMKLNTLTTGV